METYLLKSKDATINFTKNAYYEKFYLTSSIVYILLLKCFIRCSCLLNFNLEIFMIKRKKHNHSA